MRSFFKKYHILGRAYIGFGGGVIIGDLITFIISLAEGGGKLLFMPQISHLCANDTMAFALQFLLCGLIGLMFAEAGILFAAERWNFPIKCVLHFASTAPFYLLFLGFCYFSKGALWGLLILVGNVLFTYFVTWMISYFAMRAEVGAINRRIRSMRGEQE